MTPQQIALTLDSRPKGSFFSVVSRRPAKVRKGVNHVIEKISHTQFQLCDYSKTANVKNGIQSGEREAPKLPNGVAEIIVMGNCKFYKYHNGSMCFGGVISGNPSRSEFLLDGKPVSECEITDYVLSSELEPKKTRADLAEKNMTPFALVKVDNIVGIH